MNQTKKEIIGLIEPFMDKSLSEGCYMERWGIYLRYLYRMRDKDFHRFMVCSPNWDTKLARFQRGKLSIEAVFWAWIEAKILWHYDITAVLIYIRKKLWFKKYKTYIQNKYFIYEVWQDDLFIPNKPLHLYTEQEEKELLELLKKLK